MKICYLFAGQGSQRVGMSKEFFDKFEVCKEFLQNGSDSLKLDFYNLLFTQNDDINKSEFTQPAIAMGSYLAYLATMQNIKISQDLSIGHSLGEICALSINGGMDLIKSLSVLKERGRLMQESCNGFDASMMVILGLDDNKVEQICANARENNRQIWAANFNCDGQVVVAGIRSDLLSIENDFKSAGAKRVMLLNMSVASHCPLQKFAADRITEILEINESFIPVVSNVTAKEYSDNILAKELLSKQLISPVLYKESIKNTKVDCFIEFGASVLKGINKKITQIPTFSITNLKDLDEFLQWYEERA